jgi:hypothetical protein
MSMTPPMPQGNWQQVNAASNMMLNSALQNTKQPETTSNIV